MHTLTLPEDCSIQWASMFHEAMCQEPTGAAWLRLDASAVASVHTPAIQMLLCLGAAMASRMARFEIADPSQVLTKAFDDLGLAAHLHEWSVKSDA